MFVKLEIFAKFRGENKNIWNHHRGQGLIPNNVSKSRKVFHCFLRWWKKSGGLNQLRLVVDLISLFTRCLTSQVVGKGISSINSVPKNWSIFISRLFCRQRYLGSKSDPNRYPEHGTQVSPTPVKETIPKQETTIFSEKNGWHIQNIRSFFGWNGVFPPQQAC